MSKNRNFKDKMLSRAPAGYWMTQDVKATPQEIVDPEVAISSIAESLQDTDSRNKIRAYIYAGIPISTLAETFAITGYAENQYNPDVAEIIKPAISMLLTDIAIENDFMGPFRLTPQPENQKELNEIEFTSEMMDLMDEQQDLEAREQEIVKRQKRANSPAPTEGFITRSEESA